MKWRSEFASHATQPPAQRPRAKAAQVLAGSFSNIPHHITAVSQRNYTLKRKLEDLQAAFLLCTDPKRSEYLDAEIAKVEQQLLEHK